MIERIMRFLGYRTDPRHIEIFHDKIRSDLPHIIGSRIEPSWRLLDARSETFPEKSK